MQQCDTSGYTARQFFRNNAISRLNVRDVRVLWAQFQLNHFWSGLGEDHGSVVEISQHLA